MSTPPGVLRGIFEVDPLACPRCRSPMRIVAVITDPGVRRPAGAGPEPGRGRSASAV